MATSQRVPGLTLVATSGIHPHHASDASPEAMLDIAEMARKKEVVAVGECGLDYNRNFSPPDAQRRAFEAQLELAAALKKPIYLHERDADEDFTRILERYRSRLVAGVVHCFTGTRAILERYLALDLHIGLTGWICDERRGTHLIPLAKMVPRGRLMVETDCPYITPRDMRPRPASGRNEPAFVAHVAATIARHRGETLADLAAHTTETARALFGAPFLGAQPLSCGGGLRGRPRRWCNARGLRPRRRLRPQLHERRCRTAAREAGATTTEARRAARRRRRRARWRAPTPAPSSRTTSIAPMASSATAGRKTRRTATRSAEASSRSRPKATATTTVGSTSRRAKPCAT